MASATEAYRKAEEEPCCLTDERLSLIIELGAVKEEFAAFLVKGIAERKAMEEEFDVSNDVIFSYGYDCCAFTNNICENKLMIPAGMLDTSKLYLQSFFINPRLPPSASSKLPDSTIVREEPPALSPLAAIDGIDIPPKPPVRADDKSNVAAEG